MQTNFNKIGADRKDKYQLLEGGFGLFVDKAQIFKALGDSQRVNVSDGSNFWPKKWPQKKVLKDIIAISSIIVLILIIELIIITGGHEKQIKLNL